MYSNAATVCNWAFVKPLLLVMKFCFLQVLTQFNCISFSIFINLTFQGYMEINVNSSFFHNAKLFGKFVSYCYAEEINWWNLFSIKYEYQELTRHRFTSLLFVSLVGLQRYAGVPVHLNIFYRDTNIVYWTSYHDIYETFTHASTNMGKHCLQLVLTLPLFSPCARGFCLVLYSRWWTQPTHACIQVSLSAVQTSEPTGKIQADICDRNTPFHSNTLLVLLLCNILYRVSYRDNCIGICILLWKNYLSFQAYSLVKR